MMILEKILIGICVITVLLAVAVVIFSIYTLIDMKYSVREFEKLLEMEKNKE